MSTSSTQGPWHVGPSHPTSAASTDDPYVIGATANAATPTATDGAVFAAAVRTPPAPAPHAAASHAPAKAEKPAQSFMPPPRKKSGGTPWSKGLMIGLCLAAVAAVAVPSLDYLRSSRGADASVQLAAAQSVEGTATINSRPQGAQVLINGVLHGSTPLRLTLPVGTHRLELRNGTTVRDLPLTIEAGTLVREHVDLAPGSPALAMGRIEVTSEPSGAQVTVDGLLRGTTPLTLEAVEPGQRRVVITHNDVTVTRTVEVSAGAVATVVASLAAAPSGALAGWVALDSPIELQILENGRVLGTTAMDRLMLPAGRHTLDLVSTAYEVRTSTTVQVAAGRTANVTVPMPTGTLSINALPWAEVWLDGQAMGTTPLGNLSVPVGQHEIVWRHPQHGERRQTIRVTAQSPVRAGVNFSR